MLARAAHCHPPCTVYRHAWRSQDARVILPPYGYIGPRSFYRRLTAFQALPGDSGELSSLSEEILRRQRIIDEQLAELKEITVRLTPEEQKELLEVIKQKDADAVEQREQAGEQNYPKPVRDMLEAAGVLDALPYSSEPVLAGGSGVPLPRPLSYEWSNEEFVDDGEQLSDEEWSEFFQTQLDNIRSEAAEVAEDAATDDTDPDDPFAGLPDPFDDELSMPGDDIPFEPGEGVEEMLQLLEAGKPLPPDPGQIGRPKESAQSFLRRMDALQARYDAQFLKRKDWQISPEDVKALDAQWEEVAMRSDVPVTMDDIQEITPAPDIPPEIERQFKRLEWITYRLRRAYMEGTPSQPVQALASAGLLAEDAIYRDIVMECRGLPAVMGYANRMDWTHGNVELCQIWGHMSEHRPVPEWYVMVDSWLNIPYPAWYLEYVRVHFKAELFPDAFMAAYANAAQSKDKHLEEVLEHYRQWGQKVRGVPRNRRERKQLERPVLWRDAYADRPFTNQQRLRSGMLPFLERNPALTIDDIDALGSPEDMLKDPFLDTRTADFVTDPAKGLPRFAGVADEPYGRGRHLLLPMLRRMQHGASRIISLAQGYQRSSIALSSQHFPPQLQMTTSAARSQRGNQATPQSASRLRSSVPADQSAAADPTSNSSAGTSEAPAEQDHPVWTSSFVTRGKYAESSAEASDQSTAKHSIGAKDALRASQDMVKDWAAGRLSLDYPPEEDGETDSISSEPLEEHGSMQRASSPVVLHSVLSSLQQVKPGVLLSGPLPAGLDAATVEDLALRQRMGDDVAVQALAALRCRGVFAGRERPKPELPKPWQQTLAAAAGRPFDVNAPSPTVHPPLEPWRQACQVAPSASSAPAAASGTSPSAVSMGAKAGAFTEAAAVQAERDSAGSSSESSRAGLKWHPVPLWHKWFLRQKKAQRRTDEAMKALPPLKRMRAARLPTAPGSAHTSGQLRHVDAVVEAASSFVSSGKSKPAEQDHTFRLLAYTPVPRDVARARVQQASIAEPSITSNTVSSQQSSSMQQAEPASSPTAIESKAAPPRQTPDTGKRLSFQQGSGFASDSISKTKQQGGIPDLIGLMCGASSASTDMASAVDADAKGAAKAQTSGDGDCLQDSAQSKGSVPGRAGDTPRKRPLGTAWRDGSHMTIPMTTMYELNPATGQVDRITSHWNGYIMHGLGGAEQEAWDIYTRQTRLYELRGRPGCSVRFVRRNMRPTNPNVSLDLQPV